VVVDRIAQDLLSALRRIGAGSHNDVFIIFIIMQVDFYGNVNAAISKDGYKFRRL
jgi:hypothetical protein